MIHIDDCILHDTEWIREVSIYPTPIVWRCVMGKEEGRTRKQRIMDVWPMRSFEKGLNEWRTTALIAFIHAHYFQSTDCVTRNRSGLCRHLESLVVLKVDKKLSDVNLQPWNVFWSGVANYLSFSDRSGHGNVMLHLPSCHETAQKVYIGHSMPSLAFSMYCSLLFLLFLGELSWRSPITQLTEPYMMTDVMYLPIIKTMVLWLAAAN